MKIAEKYGNGTVHLTTRQGFEIPGIDMNKIDEINNLIQPIIEGLGINQLIQRRDIMQLELEKCICLYR